MNRIQYRRWKDFALRMADKGFPSTITRTKQYKETVRPAIEHNKNPEIIRIESWDHTRADYRDAEKFPWGFRCKYNVSCIRDVASRIIDEIWNPNFYDTDSTFNKWDDKWG